MRAQVLLAVLAQHPPNVGRKLQRASRSSASRRATRRCSTGRCGRRRRRHPGVVRLGLRVAVHSAPFGAVDAAELDCTVRRSRSLPALWLETNGSKQSEATGEPFVPAHAAGGNEAKQAEAEEYEDNDALRRCAARRVAVHEAVGDGDATAIVLAQVRVVHALLAGTEGGSSNVEGGAGCVNVGGGGGWRWRWRWRLHGGVCRRGHQLGGGARSLCASQLEDGEVEGEAALVVEEGAGTVVVHGVEGGGAEAGRGGCVARRAREGTGGPF
mmetsp:Transcript_16040/g.50131  ORF Transcript_16040/g.50131 Transcript_16040/m.50131 type:complete len:270 (+) Transcript_16040:780-1589(+)